MQRPTTMYRSIAALGVASLLFSAAVATAAAPSTAAAADGARCDAAPTDQTPAQRATVSASFTASWNSLAAVQDGVALYTGGQQSQLWGTYSGDRAAQQWLQYEWSGNATLTGARMSFWHDQDSDTAGNGVAVPRSWKLQSWDGAAWSDITLANGSAYGRTKTEANVVTFASPVTTTRLRAVFDASTDGTSFAAVGVSDFAVDGDAPASVDTKSEVLSSDHFHVGINRSTGGVYELLNNSDVPLCTNYVSNPQIHPPFDVDDSRWMGDVVVRANGALRTTGLSDDIRTVTRDANGVKVAYTGDASNAGGIKGFNLTEDYRLAGDGGDVLDWSLTMANTSGSELNVQDLSIPMLMNSWWNGGNQKGIYEQNVARHSFVADDGSYAYWQRPNGEGPYLVMVPKDGTSLEFRDKARAGEGVFGEQDPAWEGLVSFAIHSETLQGERAGKIGGYLPSTSAKLQAGESKTYGFTFRWADNYTDLRDALYDAGVVDAVSMPGMVIPQDTHATLAVRAKEGIDGVVGEDGKQISVTPRGIRNGYDLYDLTFPTAGPNRVDVRYGNGKRSVLQYNSIEPVEQLIDQHAKFVVDHQQARDTGRGYEGAFLQWDMSRKKPITWNDYPGGGWMQWMAGGSDDLGLSPAVFLSEQNLQKPDQAQVAALDYYIDKFIWGYMQTQTDSAGNRTYRVYHWYDGTDGSGPGTADGQATWRVMNYPHVWNTYLNMYRIAKAYPSITTQLTADDYLMRAYNTMRAYFEHPNVGTLNDASREMGSMGEMTMPDMVDTLQREGHTAEADKLEGYIREKGKEMLSREYPFASEMSIDTTAFEATYTLAKRYGNDTMARKATMASLSARGLQPLWYYYGSDNRHMGESWWNLGYETQLGAWQQQDYLKNYDAAANGIDFDEAMRSTYGAYLAGWSNINTGQIDPASENLGAASWQYQSQLGAGDSGWGFMPMIGGWWAWSGEADLGFWGGLKTASVNVVNDNILGLYAYGGEVSDSDGVLSITPKDGVRQRASVYTLGKFGFEIAQGKYTSAKVSKDLTSVQLSVESVSANSTGPTVSLTGLPAGAYDVAVDGGATSTATSDGNRMSVQLTGFSGATAEVQIRAAKPSSEQASVVTHYVDAVGAPLADPTTQVGIPGTPYTTEPRIVEGYRVSSTPSNARGTFPASGQSLEVVYSYERVAAGGGGSALASGSTGDATSVARGSLANTGVEVLTLLIIGGILTASGVASAILRRRRLN